MDIPGGQHKIVLSCRGNIQQISQYPDKTLSLVSRRLNSHFFYDPMDWIDITGPQLIAETDNDVY